MRFARCDVKGPHRFKQNDHRPSWRGYGALQRQRRLKINLREIFGVVRFSTFATVSANRRHRRLTKHGRGRQLRRPLYQLLRPVFAAVSWGAVLNALGFRPTIHCAGPYRACTSRHRSGISPLGFSVLQGSKKRQSNYTSDRNQSPHDSPPDSGKLRIAPQRIKFPEIRTLLNSFRRLGVKYGQHLAAHWNKAAKQTFAEPRGGPLAA